MISRRLQLTCLTLAIFCLDASALDAPFASTYQPPPSPERVIANVRILIGNGEEIERGSVRIREGRIVEVTPGSVAPPAPGIVIDGEGKWLTPGIIDVHSHLGVYPSPGYSPHSDGNESTAPVTAEVWAEHSVWPQDPQFPLALAGGVTSLQILPGSANLIGGRSVVLKNVSARTVHDMKFPGAPHGLKMACGENPKRVYGTQGRLPTTRMGNIAATRAAWISADEYRQQWQSYQDKKAHFESGEPDKDKEEDKEKDPPEPPVRNLQLETLAAVLDGEIRVHNHCYRADEMALMIEIAQEFGYKIASFQHAVESYKIADLLRDEGICSAMWADWGRFKLESFDAIEENIALVEKAGACAIVHSDSATDVQRLNQEAAKALAAGRRMGLSISEAQAMRWLTLNAAQSLGIDELTGSVETGKMADLVLWDGNPFSVYTRAEKVLIDGVLVFDRTTGLLPSTDFELGTGAGR